MFVALIGTIGKEIGRSYIHNRPKTSSLTLKKPVLLSSANHTSYTTNSTPTIMSHQRQHKDSNSIQNKVNISNTDDIHSCVTPRKKISVFRPQLHPLVWHHWSLLYLFYLLSYQKQHMYPHLAKNICVSKLTTNLLMLLSVSNQGLPHYRTARRSEERRAVR